jgi:hypothetical protein
VCQKLRTHMPAHAHALAAIQLSFLQLFSVQFFECGGWGCKSLSKYSLLLSNIPVKKSKVWEIP